MLVYGREGFGYISKNGISYELLEGKTIGFDQHYTSNTLFIMLDINLDDITDDFFERFESSRMLVDFMEMAGGNETCGLEEADIKKSVDKFEREHRELIDYILDNEIETWL